MHIKDHFLEKQDHKLALLIAIGNKKGKRAYLRKKKICMFHMRMTSL